MFVCVRVDPKQGARRARPGPGDRVGCLTAATQTLRRHGPNRPRRADRDQTDTSRTDREPRNSEAGGTDGTTPEKPCRTGAVGSRMDASVMRSVAVRDRFLFVFGSFDVVMNIDRTIACSSIANCPIRMPDAANPRSAAVRHDRSDKAQPPCRAGPSPATNHWLRIRQPPALPRILRCFCLMCAICAVCSVNIGATKSKAKTHELWLQHPRKRHPPASAAL